MDGLWIWITVGLIWLLTFAFVVIVCVLGRRPRLFLFQVHAHEVVVSLSAYSVVLSVDGGVQDQFAAQNIRVATVRAQIDGEEFKAFVRRTMRGAVVEATYGGRPLECLGARK